MNKMSCRITIKLQIDLKSKKVVFAEADKDFADFLFTLLSLSVGNVIKLLSSNGMVGSIGHLYDSFRDLNDTYVRPKVNKNSLLNPSLSLDFSPTVLSLTSNTYKPPDIPKKAYTCSNAKCPYQCCWSDVPTSKCYSSCGHLLNKSMIYMEPPTDNDAVSPLESGFVKSAVTYMVMDNLEVEVTLMLANFCRLLCDLRTRHSLKFIKIFDWCQK